jgi:uncharacterized protein YcbK (DUF882 family)
MNDTPVSSRRRFLRHTARIAAAAALPAVWTTARAAVADGRSLAMRHLHTGERIEVVYAVGDRYVPQALGSLDRFLRDHYSGDVGTMDPRLFDALFRVQAALGTGRAFEIISGYRCPATNTLLRRTRGGGVATHSLHMEGRAIDVRLPGIALTQLRDAALSLGMGGVGFYPREDFVHIDTGRVRRW